MVLRLKPFSALLLLVCAVARAAEVKAPPPEVEAGERLFLETRFAQFFYANGGKDVNVPLAKGDPVLARVSQSGRDAPVVKGPFAGQSINCASCHLNEELKGRRGLPGRGVEAFSDFARRSPVPRRADGRTTTERNSRSLVGALDAGPDGLFNFDGQYAGVEALIKGMLTGRNFGWLPNEQATARKHFARVLREDSGSGALAGEFGKLSYAVLLRGTDAAIPDALRLPEKYRVDVATASDDVVLDAGARLIAAYLGSLEFSRDERGQHNGSPYDAFLAANKLPRAPASGESNAAYTQRLRVALEALAAPKFVDNPKRKLKYHDQAFHFGEEELRGLKIFLRTPTDASKMVVQGVDDTEGRMAARSAVGNCAACHTPPHFTDFGFHNTGAAQDDFDALNGAGAFARLKVPALNVRNADYNAYLPATTKHPRAKGPFLALPGLGPPPPTDLGLWNVYRNPDMPAPQPALEKLLNPTGKLSRDIALEQSIARFKTTGLRDLGQSGPYLHTGRFRTLEEVLMFYQRMTALARDGKLRNAPEEFTGVRLEAEDVKALAAFLRALNEDYQ